MRCTGRGTIAWIGVSYIPLVFVIAAGSTQVGRVCKKDSIRSTNQISIHFKARNRGLINANAVAKG